MTDNSYYKYIKYKKKYLDLKYGGSTSIKTETKESTYTISEVIINKKTNCNGSIEAKININDTSEEEKTLSYLHPQLIPSTYDKLKEILNKDIFNEKVTLNDEFDKEIKNIPVIIENLPYQKLIGYTTLLNSNTQISDDIKAHLQTDMSEFDYSYEYLIKLFEKYNESYPQLFYKENIKLDDIGLEYIIFPDIKYKCISVDDVKLDDDIKIKFRYYSAFKFNLVIAYNNVLIPITILLDNDSETKTTIKDRLITLSTTPPTTPPTRTNSEINNLLLKNCESVINNFHKKNGLVEEKEFDENHCSILCCLNIYNRYFTLAFRYLNKYFESEYLTYQRSQQWMIYNKFKLLVDNANKINLIIKLTDELIPTNDELKISLNNNNIEYFVNSKNNKTDNHNWRSKTGGALFKDRRNESIMNKQALRITSEKPTINFTTYDILTTNITYSDIFDANDLYKYQPVCIITILIRNNETSKYYTVRLISQLFNKTIKINNLNLIIDNGINNRLFLTELNIIYNVRVEEVTDYDMSGFIYLKYGHINYDTNTCLRLSPLKILRIMYARLIFNKNDEYINIFNTTITNNKYKERIIQKEYYFSEKNNYYIQYKDDNDSIYVFSYLPQIKFKTNNYEFKTKFIELINLLCNMEDKVLSNKNKDDNNKDEKHFNNSQKVRELLDNTTDLIQLYNNKDSFKYDLTNLTNDDKEEINEFIRKFLIFLYLDKPYPYDYINLLINDDNKKKIIKQHKQFPYSVWAHYPVVQGNYLFHMQISNFQNKNVAQLNMVDSIFRNLNNTVYRLYYWDFLYNVDFKNYIHISDTNLMPDIRSYFININNPEKYKETLEKDIEKTVSLSGTSDIVKQQYKLMGKKLISEFDKLIDYKIT